MAEPRAHEGSKLSKRGGKKKRESNKKERNSLILTFAMAKLIFHHFARIPSSAKILTLIFINDELGTYVIHGGWEKDKSKIKKVTENDWGNQF